VKDAAQRLIELGSLRGAYGVHGWVHVAAESPDAEVLRAARQWWRLDGEQNGDEQPPFEVTIIRRHGAGWVAKLAGVDDPEHAERLRGTRIAVARGEFPALPDGEYYWIDLIGARVINRQGECLGEVQGLRSNGVHDVLEISADGASSPMLVPMVDQYVDRIEIDPGPDGDGERVVRVDWERAWL
jgi:16S rRNA processing protein RimM